MTRIVGKFYYCKCSAFYEGLGGVAGPRVLDRVAGLPLPKVGYLFG